MKIFTDIEWVFFLFSFFFLENAKHIGSLGRRGGTCLPRAYPFSGRQGMGTPSVLKRAVRVCVCPSEEQSADLGLGKVSPASWGTPAGTTAPFEGVTVHHCLSYSVKVASLPRRSLLHEAFAVAWVSRLLMLAPKAKAGSEPPQGDSVGLLLNSGLFLSPSLVFPALQF